MSERKKIGVRVDPELWERFKNFVEDKHGTTRGTTGTELEKAIKQYLGGSKPADSIDRIEGDVAQNKVLLSEIHESLAESDGGTVAPAPSPSSTDTHTHTEDAVDPDVEAEFDRLQGGHPANQDDTDTDDGDDSDTLSKPGRKASHRKKAKYVFHELSNGGDTAIVPASAVESEVDRLWGFGERTTTKVIDRVFDRYHAEAVNKGPAWFVALGRTSQARDDAIVEWQDGDGEDTKIVLEDAFDGFDDDGLPAGVRSNQDNGGGRKR
jgi:hypothetical protein